MLIMIFPGVEKSSFIPRELWTLPRVMERGASFPNLEVSVLRMEVTMLEVDMRNFQVIDVPDDGTLFAVDCLVCNTPVIGADDKAN